MKDINCLKELEISSILSDLGFFMHKVNLITILYQTTINNMLSHFHRYRYFHFVRYLADICRYVGQYPCMLSNIWLILINRYPEYPISGVSDTDANTNMADTDIQFPDTNILASAKYIGEQIYQSNPSV